MHDDNEDTKTVRLGPVEKTIVGIVVSVITAGIITGIGIAWSINSSIGEIKGAMGVLGLRADRIENQIVDHETRLRQLERLMK